jgi:hypothetical protein
VFSGIGSLLGIAGYAALGVATMGGAMTIGHGKR